MGEIARKECKDFKEVAEFLRELVMLHRRCELCGHAKSEHVGLICLQDGCSCHQYVPCRDVDPA